MRSHRLVILATVAAVAGAQNLVTNPGFEQGFTAWGALWTRTAGAGTASVVASPVKGGTGALHVAHSGSEDWALQQQQTIPARPGDFFEGCAWVRGSLDQGEAGLSVILYDSAGQVIDWTWGAAAFGSGTTSFVKYCSRFIVPEKAASLRARLVGSGPCDLHVDDVSLVKVDSLGAASARSFFLRNAVVEAEIRVPSLALTATDLATGLSWTTAGAYDFRVKAVDTTNDTCLLACEYLPGAFDASVAFWLDGREMRGRIEADSASPMPVPIRFPGVIASAAGKYLVVPRATGLIFPVEGDYPFWDFTMWDWKSTMSFVAITDMESGYGLLSDEPWATRALIRRRQTDGLLTPQLEHAPLKGVFGKPRVFSIVPVGAGGYVSVCKAYRANAERRGIAKTFDTKIAENPNVEKLLGTVDFWVTGSNSGLVDFVDTLIGFGIDRAILSLGGSWAGPGGAGALIDSVNARGMLSSRYDIFTDVWPPDQYPDKTWLRREGYPGDIIVDRNGELQKGWVAYVENNVPFQGYVACSKTHTGYAKKYLPAELADRKYNCRFIDVELAASLMECYANAHPVNRYEDALARVDALAYVKDGCGLVCGSEEARDLAFHACDYGEGTMTVQPVGNAGYDWSNPVASPDSVFVRYNVDPAIRVPLHGLVYHDVHVPTWYTGDGMSKVPAYWDEKTLLNLLYGTMPLFMPPDQAYWIANLTRFVTTAHTAAALFRMTGRSAMTGHRMLSTDFMVQETEFANGWKAAVNFGGSPFNYEGSVLPAKGFFARRGEFEIRRVTEGAQTFTASYTPGRLYLDPEGGTAEYRGVRSDGAVFIREQDSCLHLALVGDQSWVEIRPEQLPWAVQSMRILTAAGRQRLTLSTDGNGWIRLGKVAQERFYRIEGDAMLRAGMAGLTSGKWLIRYVHSSDGVVVVVDAPWAMPQGAVVDILDARGRVVARSAWGTGVREKRVLLARGAVAPGAYLCRVTVGSTCAHLRTFVAP